MGLNEVVIHDSCLYEYEPYSVECMAVDDSQGILAVARRADEGEERKLESLLEFWNVIKSPVFHIKTKRLGSGGVEALLWMNSTLLSSHLDGSILIHQLHKPGSIKVQVCPSPLWSLVGLHANTLCAGSDSGGIFFLSFDFSKLTVEKTVNIGFGSRVLSLAAKENIVAAGSIDKLSIVDVIKGKILHTFKLPRVEKRKPTIVWCLGFINHLLVSGDSRGFVSFWNVKNAAMFQTIETHQADVLSLCITDDIVHAAGVDPTIVSLCPIQNRQNFRIRNKLRMHTADVHALVSSGDKLISGGAQHQFFVTSSNRYAAATKTPICSYIPKKNFVVYQYSKYIIIWLLGKAKGHASKKGDFLLAEEPVKLAKVATKASEYIVSSALNEDGNMLALSTHKSLILYRTTLSEVDHSNVSNCDIQIAKVSEFGFCASCMTFTNNQLFYATGTLNLCKVDCEQPETTTTLLSREESGEALKISVRCHGKQYRIVLLTTRNEVLFKSLNSDELCKLNLKAVQSPIMDIQFATDKSLFLLCASRERALYEITPETESGQVRKEDLSIQQLGVGTNSNELLMLHNDDYVQSMDVSSWGLCFVSACGEVRLLVSVDGKRVILYSDTTSATKYGTELPYSIKWLDERTVLLTTSSSPSEPSQGTFRLKRFRQN